MSAAEILAELPNLNPAELESIYLRAIELHQLQSIEGSPELLAAIDEADESFLREDSVTLEELNRRLDAVNSTPTAGTPWEVFRSKISADL